MVKNVYSKIKRYSWHELWDIIDDRLRNKIRDRINLFLGPIRLRFINLNERDFTIISNNCWGGHCYRYFNLPYNSPTIGLYFFSSDFIRFVSHLDEYLRMELKMISVTDSIHYDELVKYHPGSLNKPIGRLGDDVEIVFLHYNSNKEAKSKWDRRSRRVNLNNVIVKFSEMNGCTKEHLLAFDKLPYERKFVFVTKDYDINSQVIFREYFGMPEITNDTTLFRKYVDLIKLVRGEPFKKRQ